MCRRYFDIRYLTISRLLKRKYLKKKVKIKEKKRSFTLLLIIVRAIRDEKVDMWCFVCYAFIRGGRRNILVYHDDVDMVTWSNTPPYTMFNAEFLLQHHHCTNTAVTGNDRFRVSQYPLFLIREIYIFLLLRSTWCLLSFVINHICRIINPD